MKFGQCNVITPVCHSVHRRGRGWLHMTGGVCIQKGSAARGVYLRGECIEEGVLGRPPQIHGILWDTVNKRTVRIRLNAFLFSDGSKSRLNLHFVTDSFLNKDKFGWNLIKIREITNEKLLLLPCINGKGFAIPAAANFPFQLSMQTSVATMSIWRLQHWLTSLLSF